VKILMLFLAIVGGYGTVLTSIVLVRQAYHTRNFYAAYAVMAAFFATVTIVCAQQVLP